jgi:hypothetical protein
VLGKSSLRQAWILHVYVWKQKKVTDGPESGLKPCFVKSLLDLLLSQGCIVGGTLCGVLEVIDFQFLYRYRGLV